MVGKAYAVLSDQDKRDSYDRYGADGPQVQSNFSRGGTRHYHQGGYYDDDFNPEDIFNMFFGGGMPTGIFFLLYFLILILVKTSSYQKISFRQC